jgi:hypothetical protein
VPAEGFSGRKNRAESRVYPGFGGHFAEFSLFSNGSLEIVSPLSVVKNIFSRNAFSFT